MVSSLSSSYAHVLGAQDITDLFNFKQRAGVYYQVLKIEAKLRVFLNMIIQDWKFFERLQDL